MHMDDQQVLYKPNAGPMDSIWHRAKDIIFIGCVIIGTICLISIAVYQNQIATHGTREMKVKLLRQQGEYVEAGRSRYKFYKIPLSCTDAALTCEKDGAYLVIIKDHTELEMLRDMFRNEVKDDVFVGLTGRPTRTLILPKLKSDITEAQCKSMNLHWVMKLPGLHPLNCTVNEKGGVSLKQYLYKNVTLQAGTTYCFAVTQKGLLRGYKADYKAPYICEKD